jgi:hypothetical protein
MYVVPAFVCVKYVDAKSVHERVYGDDVELVVNTLVVPEVGFVLGKTHVYAELIFGAFKVTLAVPPPLSAK